MISREMIKEGFVTACRLCVLGTLVAFVGWCFEKLGMILIYGKNADRGFLHLPLCPIYGISIIAIYLSAGTPEKLSGIIGGRVRLTRLWEKVVKGIKWRKYAFYFVFVTLLATAAELVTGLIMKTFGAELWSYSDKPLNLFGVICPQFSLLWGVMITAFMALLWKPLYAVVSAVSRSTAVSLGVTLGACVCTDFAVSLIYLLVTGSSL